jgi:hypothetical protein
MKSRLLKDKSNTLQAPDMSYKPVGKLVPGVISTATTTVPTSVHTPNIPTTSIGNTRVMDGKDGRDGVEENRASQFHQPIPHSYAGRHTATPPTGLSGPMQRSDEVRPVLVSTINGKVTAADGARVSFLSSLAR